MTDDVRVSRSDSGIGLSTGLTGRAKGGGVFASCGRFPLANALLFAAPGLPAGFLLALDPFLQTYYHEYQHVRSLFSPLRSSACVCAGVCLFLGEKHRFLPPSTLFVFKKCLW